MNTKKHYTAPTLKVVDVEVHLMLGVSANGEGIDVKTDETYDSQYEDII